MAHTCANRHTHINRDTSAHTYPSGPEWVRGPRCVGEDSSSPRGPQRPGQPRLPTPLGCDCPGHRGAGQCHIHQSRGEVAAEDREAPEGGTCPGPLTQAREAAAEAGLPALASIWPQRHPDQPGGDWELDTRRSLLPQLCVSPQPQHSTPGGAGAPDPASAAGPSPLGPRPRPSEATTTPGPPSSQRLPVPPRPGLVLSWSG